LVLADLCDRNQLCRRLRSWGHSVSVASATLDFRRIYRPDVAIVDIDSVPPENLPSICSISKQLDTCLVAISDRNDELMRLAPQDAGFDHFFAVPTDLILLRRFLLMLRLVVTTEEKVVETSRDNLKTAQEMIALCAESRQEIHRLVRRNA
jgi:hypothetical protein